VSAYVCAAPAICNRVNVWSHSFYTAPALTGVIADLAAFPELNENTYSWVNGTITNIGTVAICSVAFASRDIDLTLDALDIFPINLPTTALDEALFDSVDLAPGDVLEFAYFLPFDDARNAPAFVGLANSLHACQEAKEKFVPELPEMEEVAAKLVDAANDAVDETQATTGGVLDTVQEVAKDLVDGTQQKLGAAIDAIQNVLKQPEEEVAASADTTATATETKPVADVAADANSVEEETTPKAVDGEPPVAELPTKQVQEAEATSPAGTRSASGSVLLLGMIAALSVAVLFA
jgi:hypothetical protein